MTAYSDKTKRMLQQLSNALDRFEAVLEAPTSDIVRDAAIQRFEFTLDLSWKALKAYLEDAYGVTCQSPKACFRAAFQQGLIEYSDQWLYYVELRNQTAHSYNESEAQRIFEELPEAARALRRLREAFPKF